MASIRHRKVATGTNNERDNQVSVDAWNEAHALTGTPNYLMGYDSAGNATDVNPTTLTGVVTTRTELASLTAGVYYLNEAGREGTFVWSSANLSVEVAADTQQGLYVAPASDTTGATGAWVRKFAGPAIATWFGVSTSGTATTNATAINQALTTLQNLGSTFDGYGVGGIALHIPAGLYLFNTAITVSYSAVITGEFAGMFSGGGTKLEFTNGTGGIEIAATNGWARLEGLWLKGSAAAAVPGSAKHGLQTRGKVIASNMFIQSFDHGIHCDGTPGFNCNGSSFENIACQDNAWGTYTDGPDGNNIQFTNVSCIGNQLGGHFDSSFLGCIYVGGDLSTNGSYNSTYRNRCTDTGHIYMCLAGQEAWCSANAPTGAATSNQGWIYIGDGAAAADQPQWTAAQTWYFSAPYAMDPNNNNARSVFRDIYVEPNQNPAIMTWPGVSYVGSDTQNILTPDGSAYFGVIRSGFNGVLSIGGINASSLENKGWAIFRATDNSVVFDIDPAQKVATVSGVLNANQYVNSAGGYLATSKMRVVGDSADFITLPVGSVGYQIGGTTVINGSKNATLAEITASVSLGYGAGAGGAVTQLTSQTTGVTLNKASGAITLFSAAGSTAWQTFTVTNSLVAADDVIKVCQKSGANKYMIHVTAVGAGSFEITFATTGGVAVEAPVFNFAVIKGAAA